MPNAAISKQNPSPLGGEGRVRGKSSTPGYTAEHARKGSAETLPTIEVFPNQYPNYEILIEIPEFTSVCPKTGLPDFGTITVRYIPDKLVAELKALKLYFNGYRNIGIFQENIVNRVLRDFAAATQPIFCEVTGAFNARGGMNTKITACFGQKPIQGIGIKTL